MFINIVYWFNSVVKATFYGSVSSCLLYWTQITAEGVHCFFSLSALQLIFLQKVGCTAKVSSACEGSIWAPNDEWVEGGGGREREKEVCKVTRVPPQCQHCNRDRLQWEGHVPFLSVSNTESRWQRDLNQRGCQGWRDGGMDRERETQSQRVTLTYTKQQTNVKLWMTKCNSSLLWWSTHPYADGWQMEVFLLTKHFRSFTAKQCAAFS